MGTKARQVGTRGKALLEKRIAELEDEVFVLGENKAGLEVKVQDLIEVNDEQRVRLTDASLLRIRIDELEAKLEVDAE
jgi:hypothetical protein